MEIPGDLRFAVSHEWARVNDDGTVTIGISEFAQEQLGDLVYVETPEIDLECEAGQGVAVVESVKAASDLYAPITGVIIDANANLTESPEIINDSPYDDGWIFKIQPSEINDIEKMMSPDDYQAMIERDQE